MPTPPPSILSLALTSLRKAARWSQKDLAAAAGVRRLQVSQYETGTALDRQRLEELAALMRYDAADVDSALLFFDQLTARPRPPAAAAAAESPATPTPDERLVVGQVTVRVAQLFAGRLKAQLASAMVAERLARERAEAALLWQELQPCTGRQRRLLVESSPRFQGWALCERLCAESARAAAHCAGEAIGLARLAVRVAELVVGAAAWRSRLQGYARAFLANAWRVDGKLRAATVEFAAAWKLWREGAAGDAGLLPEWRLLDLEASLRRTLRQFARALELLDQARAVAPQEELGRILLNRASTLEQAGEVAAAVETLRDAEPLIKSTGDARLRCVLEFNLAVNLCHLHRLDEAEARLPGLRQLAVELGNGLDLVRVLWLSGRLAKGRGRRDEARAAFEQVRDEFLACRNAFETALVSLELAVLYLEEGRPREVRELAAAMAWIFSAEGIRREPLAALRLFCEAAVHETATVEQVERLLAVLRAAPPGCGGRR
jgi:transcriptional regulator with XRE-family HTH domain